MISNKISVFKKIAKIFILMAIICYSLSVCVANIFYYKYKKEEIFLLPKINFGIDIVGGNQITVSIDVDDVIKELKNNSKDFISNYCKETKFNCIIQDKVIKDGFLIKITKNNVSKKLDENAKHRKLFIRELRKNIIDTYDVEVVKNDEKDFIIKTYITPKNFNRVFADTTDKTIAVLKNRIDGVGVKEISVQRYGNNKIVILVPESVNMSRIKDIINRTAKLDFHLMDSIHIFAQKPKQIMKDHVFLQSYKPINGRHIIYMVESKAVLSGSCISNVQPVIDGISNSINFRLNSVGAKKFSEITKNNIGRLLAIVFDGKVLMAPMINTQIAGGSGSITGNFSSQEVQDLSVLLRSGSLPAKISISSERLLNSIFNKHMLSSFACATCVCLLLIICLMIMRYKELGFVVFITLFLNFIFIITVISIFDFTLTLPGIAGLILMLGMATDSNILIYEKMKELKRNGINDGKTIIKNSFSKAIRTILDANITTIIAGIALFGFGGSFIKGFSITLIFGIFCSLFTSINMTKIIINEIYNIRKKISI